MRRFSLFLFSILSLSAMAQVKVDNFESGNKGWVTVSSKGYCDVRENEYKTGINLSDHVLYAQHAVGDDNWAGAMLKPYTTSGYRYLHAYIYHSNGHQPNLKVSDTNAQDLLPLNTIKAGEWQDVVFDISAYQSSGIEFVFFMVDRSDVSELAWMLVDEIVLSNDPSPRTEVVGTGSTPQTEPDGDYQLVWADEFSGTTLDRDIWNIEVNDDGGGNNELQYYCEKAVTVENGNLLLTATKESYKGRSCTSGRINTLGKVFFTYGKVEARIKMPSTANGLWPAFWMMGNDFSEVGWPACGEIDIVEMGNANGIKAGTQDRYFNGAYHWGTRWDDHRSYARDITLNYSVQDGDYHLFTCIWNAESIAMYVDLDQYPSSEPYCVMTIPKTNTDNSAPGYYFHKPNFIIFNLAVGGNFPAIHDINAITALSDGPRAMMVDYVRVYQKKEAGETFSGKQTSTALTTISEEKQQTTKVLIDGQIYIKRNNHIYTITGQQIQ